MVLTKEKRTGMGMLLVSVLFGGAFFLLICQPQQEECARMESRLAERQVQIVSVQNFMNEHIPMDVYETEIENKNQRLHKILPDDLEQSRFIGTVQQEAFKRHIIVAGIVPGKVQENGKLIVQPVQIVIHCGYFSLLDFLEALEQSERFLRMENVDVHSLDEQGRLECKIDLKIFAGKE